MCESRGLLRASLKRRKQTPNIDTAQTALPWPEKGKLSFLAPLWHQPSLSKQSSPFPLLEMGPLSQMTLSCQQQLGKHTGQREGEGCRLFCCCRCIFLLEGKWELPLGFRKQILAGKQILQTTRFDLHAACPILLTVLV